MIYEVAMEDCCQEATLEAYGRLLLLINLAGAGSGHGLGQEQQDRCRKVRPWSCGKCRLARKGLALSVCQRAQMGHRLLLHLLNEKTAPQLVRVSKVLVLLWRRQHMQDLLRGE